jgi:predicted porin
VKKNSNRVLALAVGLVGSLAVSGAYAAGPTLYGQLNVSLDHLDNDTDSGLNLSSNASRIGIKGDIEIREGLKGLYQVETEVRVDNGEGTWATRDTFLGLQGNFGTVRAGQIDTPVKVIGRRAELFGDQVGDARNLTRVVAAPTGNLARFDERPRNTIQYATPKFSGLQGIVQYATNLDTASTANNDNDLISLAVHYAQGPAFVGLGYEKVGNVNVGEDDPSIVRLGGYYDVTSAFRVTALWQAVSGVASEWDYDVYGIGARYRQDNWTLKAQFYQLNDEVDEWDSSLFAVGAEYALAKAVTLYLVYAGTSNDDNRTITPYGQGRGDNLAIAAANAGDSASGLSLGTIVRF